MPLVRRPGARTQRVAALAMLMVLVLGVLVFFWQGALVLVPEPSRVLVDKPVADPRPVWHISQLGLASASFAPDPARQSTPALVFIKGMKVGGTTVALALSGATRRYRVPMFTRTKHFRVYDPANGTFLGKSRLPFIRQVLDFQPRTARWDLPKENRGSMFFQHGFKAPWMNDLLLKPEGNSEDRGVRFTTVLRDPVDQTLSNLNYEINRKYFAIPDTEQCRPEAALGSSNHTSLEIRDENLGAAVQYLKTANLSCRDDTRRRNATLIVGGAILRDAAHVKRAHRYRLKFGPGDAEYCVKGTMDWITASDRNYIPKSGWLAGYQPEFAYPTAEELLRVLTRDFFLVGVTERIDEFLVLLALAHGWDPASMYYVPCKKPLFSIPRAEYARHFPNALETLTESTRVPREGYAWAKRTFAELVDSLGATFADKVRAFKVGLKAYQKEFGEDAWKTVVLADGKLVSEC